MLEEKQKRKIIFWHFVLQESQISEPTGLLEITNWTWNNRLVPNRKRSTSGLYIVTPCLFNLYAEYIMRNAGLEEAQAEIKIARRNINNLRDADDTTLMAESEEELKSLLMR